MSAEKHRDEEENVSIDFVDRLDGDTISTIDILRVHNRDGRNVSSQFGSPTGSVSATKVLFVLGKATSILEQKVGLYHIYCEITTGSGRKLVETPSITVTDRASI